MTHLPRQTHPEEPGDDSSWMRPFGEYRRENEQWRAAFAADFQRVILDGLGKRTKPRKSRANRVAGTLDEESDTGKSKTSVDDPAGQLPSGRGVETSRDGRSSGSVSWGDMGKAWNLDSAPGQEEKEPEHLRATHCRERKTQEKSGERRESRPNLLFSFSSETPGQARRSNPTEDVILGESTGGVGMRNQECFPVFCKNLRRKGGAKRQY